MKAAAATLLIATLAAGPCNKSQSGAAQNAVSGVKVNAKDACPTGDVAALDAESQRPTLGGTLMAIDGGTEELSTVRPPQPKFAGTVMAPPAKAGESIFDVAGCLALDEANEQAAARFPAPPATEAAPKTEAIRVNTVGRGVVVSHDLVHTCCLEGRATAEVAGGVVTVTEQLSGTPCDCKCSSTVRTAVGLAPGTYRIVVKVDEAGNVREAGGGEATIPGK